MPANDRPVVGAIDLGGTKILSLVLDPDDAVIGEDLRATEADRGPDVVIARMAESLRAALASAGAGHALTAAGVAAPGPIDFDRGVVVQAPNLPGWREVAVAARLAERIGCPVALENDANAAAWGEFIAGAGRGTRNMIYLTVSTGIGGGLILNGALYRGSDGAAGELGHVPLVADGPLCGCGAHGCLEQLASGTAIARRAAAVVAAGGAPLLRQLPLSGELSAEEVHQAALEGDRDARAVITEAGVHLGSGLVAFVNIFNPDVIVIGGGAAKIGAMLLDPAIAELNRRAMQISRERVRIVPAALGNRSGALGVAALARDLASL